LKDAIKLRRDPSVGPHSSDSCDLSLQLVAADISVPCEKLTANPSGQVSAQFKKDEATGANPCDKILDINVPCQLPGISFFVTGQATGSISSGDESDDCGRTLSINVPCQLDRLDFYNETSERDPVDAPSNGVVNTSSIVYLGTVTGGCDDEKMRVPIVRRKFKVPVTKVSSDTGDNAIISVTPRTPSGSNITTYILGPGTKMKKRNVYIPSGLTFSINSTTKKLEIKITRELCTLWSDSDSQFGSAAALTGSVDVGECT
jgi:hypothetical protein